MHSPLEYQFVRWAIAVIAVLPVMVIAYLLVAF